MSGRRGGFGDETAAGSSLGEGPRRTIAHNVRMGVVNGLFDVGSQWSRGEGSGGVVAWREPALVPRTRTRTRTRCCELRRAPERVGERSCS